MQNHCKKCGRCCWDWKGGSGEKCEHLADDMVACLRYERLAELEPNCHVFPASHLVACDLPDDCGYVIEWKRLGLI